MLKRSVVCAVIFGSMCLAQAQQTVDLTGRVINTRGAPIWNASVKLTTLAGYATTTSLLGKFSLTGNPAAVLPSAKRTYVQNIPSQFTLVGKTLTFSLPARAASGSIAIFTADGRKIVSMQLNNLNEGQNSVSLPKFPNGLHILHVSIGAASFIGTLNNGDGAMHLGNTSSNVPTGITFVPAAAAAASVDTLYVQKNGYSSAKVGIPAYTDTGITITMADSCWTPAVPDSLHLDTIKYMNDPFLFLSGTRMTDPSQWVCRRNEISQILQRYQYGFIPPTPDSVRGTYSGTTLTVKVYYQGRSLSYTVTVTLPTKGTAPYGAMIGITGVSTTTSWLTADSIAYMTLNTANIATDPDEAGAGAVRTGAFYTLYGASQNTGVLMAWAWGAWRIMDALYAIPKIDPLRVAVQGYSRDGKTALVAGAFDERMCCTFPLGGGGGAESSWRINIKGNIPPISNNAKTQTVPQILNEAPLWFGNGFNLTNFGSDVNRLPYDEHECVALVAPRPVCVTEATGDYWNCPAACWNAMKAAQQVYKYLGVPNNIAFASAPGAHGTFTTHQDSVCENMMQYFINGNTSVKFACFDSTSITGACPGTVGGVAYPCYFSIQDTFGPSYWTAPGTTSW